MRQSETPIELRKNKEVKGRVTRVIKQSSQVLVPETNVVQRYILNLTELRNVPLPRVVVSRRCIPSAQGTQRRASVEKRGPEILYVSRDVRPHGVDGRTFDFYLRVA